MPQRPRFCPGTPLATLLPLLLLCATQAASAAVWQLVKTTPDPGGQIKLAPARADNYEARSAGVGEYTRTCRNGRQDDYNFKAQFDSPATVIDSGADGTTFTLKVQITCTGNYGPSFIANAVKFSASGISCECLALSRDGKALPPDAVGVWAGHNDGPVVKEAEGTFEFKVGPGAPDKFSIYAVSVGIGCVTAWDYEKAQGPVKPAVKPPVTDKPSVTTPTTPTTKPPVKPTVTPPATPQRPPLQIRLELITQKYRPEEMLLGTVLVTTGLKEGETVGGTLSLSVARDSTSEYLFWAMATGGRRALSVPKVAASPPALASREEPVLLDEPIEMIGMIPFFIGAPAEPGEYSLVARLATDDKRSVAATVPFDVLEAAGLRRLMMGAVTAGNVPAGVSCPVGAGFAFGDVSVPGAPQSQAKAFGSVQAASAAAGAFSLDLPEQSPALAPSDEGRNLAGQAAWQVTFPRPGTYLVSVQVLAPYYGARERTAVVTVSAGGTAAGGMENAAAAAAGRGTSAGAGGTGPAPGDGQGAGGGAGEQGGHGDGAEPAGTLIPSLNAMLAMENGAPIVVALYEGPLSLGNVPAGSTLVSIDGAEVKGLSLAQLAQKLRYKPAGAFTLVTVRKPNGEEVVTPVSAPVR